MYLSSTDQSPSNNPSSSSFFLHLTNSSHELGHSHLSNFSIRDYVFSYRTKNFEKSWPFSSTSLQLCLKHGLSDPLPPIQTLEALSLKKLDISHVETISYKRKLDKDKEDFENGLLENGWKSKRQVAIINKNPKKKIGLIVKPGACMDSGLKEDHSNLFAPSESMALRTCPICKTFSSASNTTLNAHIDQCLCVDSGQQPISKSNRPKGKPRMKVKSMIDIYASAKGCTLEDLDKRNGTQWVVVSSYSNKVVSDNKPEVSNKGKRRSVLHVCVDEDVSGIGPVYIDDKGQKLRILSEFNKKTAHPSREHEDVIAKKSSREGKSNKSLSKILRGEKKYKHRKQVPQSEKLVFGKGIASEIQEYQKGNSEGRCIEMSETLFNQRMLTRRHLSRNRVLRDQPSVSGHSLTEDPLVVIGSSHVSTDLSETVSVPLNSQNSWKICGESQVFGKRWALSRRKSSANPLRCSIPVNKAFAFEAKTVTKLKKTQLDFSEDEMTQEWELTDYDDRDDNGGTYKFLPRSYASISEEDNDYESYEETGNNKGADDDRLDDADAGFESMIYEKSWGKTAEQGSSFMGIDPIPIPGPPGSFLPSPWDMRTDALENHGNSSVTTSPVQSSQDQFDLTDRNASESPLSAISNLAAPESLSLHNIITIDKRPCRFRDSDLSCCCQRKESKSAFEETTFGRPPPHMIQQDMNFQSQPVPAIASNSNPVLRLMGKDLMVINQKEEPSHEESSIKPTSQLLDLSKTQQVSPSLHRSYGRNSLSFGISTSCCNIP